MPIERNDDDQNVETPENQEVETKDVTTKDGEKLIIEMPSDKPQSPEEDAEYGERVRKRINKEVAKRRAAEREIQTHQEYSRKQDDRIRELERITNYADYNSVTASEHNLATANARAQEMYRNARVTGNSEDELKAVQILSSIAADAKALNLYKQQNQHRFNGFQSNQQPQQQQQQQQQQQYNKPQAQKPRLAQEAQKWLTNNDWFDEHSPNHDSDARSSAIAISTDLENEGYDVNSPDHYRELNKRLREEMPSRPSPKSAQRGSPVSAPTRGTAPGRRVKVSEFQRDFAARHNIPIERLAKEIE